MTWGCDHSLLSHLPLSTPRALRPLLCPNPLARSTDENVPSVPIQALGPSWERGLAGDIGVCFGEPGKAAGISEGGNFR